MPNSKGQTVVCIDFDAVLHNYTHWNGGRLNEPVAGAAAATRQLTDNNFVVILYTTRGADEIIHWLTRYNFQWTHINQNPEIQGQNPGKPIADIYIDDRAIQFNGSWESTLREISRFKPWTKRVQEGISYHTSARNHPQAPCIACGLKQEFWVFVQFCPAKS